MSRRHAITKLRAGTNRAYPPDPEPSRLPARRCIDDVVISRAKIHNTFMLQGLDASRVNNAPDNYAASVYNLDAREVRSNVETEARKVSYGDISFIVPTHTIP